MAPLNLPFAASATRRVPTSGELADGYGCGDADLNLFDFLAWWLTGQIDAAIEGAAFTTDDADLTQLREAIKALSRVQTTGQIQKFVLVADQKTAGTSGGTFTSGAWRTRDLNTVIADPSSMVGAGVTLSSNRITLPAGKWLIEASAPAIACDGHKTRLYNITDSAVIAYGTTENMTAPSTTDQVQTRSQAAAVVTLAASKAIELQHVCITTSTAGIGFGIASDYGLGANNGVETYALLRASKLD